MAPPDAGIAYEKALLDWLVNAGREAASPAELLEAFSLRLVQAGLPLWRTAWWVPALHPVVRGTYAVWESGKGFTEQLRPHGSELTDLYQRSPFAALLEHGLEEARHRLPGPPGQRRAYPVLDDLARDGASDYLAMPIRVTADRLGCGSFTTRAPDGFSPQQVSLVKALLPPLGCVLGVHYYRQLTATLLDVYVGHQTGNRILSGEIRRGSGQTLRAVLWFCDMRGFTGLSDRLPRTELIALLNGYFDIMGGAVEARGGEILKFMGDAMLAIFPLPQEGESAAVPPACEGGAPEAAVACRAMEAAETALAGMSGLNRERRAWGQPILRAGIALHVGEVMYGNIGTARRLDFTVIGPAVNLTSRIESLCKDMNRTLLTSAAFARICPGKLTSLGVQTVRGLNDPIEVFGFADEGATGGRDRLAAPRRETRPPAAVLTGGTWINEDWNPRGKEAV